MSGVRGMLSAARCGLRLSWWIFVWVVMGIVWIYFTLCVAYMRWIVVPFDAVWCIGILVVSPIMTIPPIIAIANERKWI